MKPIAVTEKLAVAPQPKLSDFQEFRRQGFTTVVNNRPDGEGPGQLGSAAEEAAAHSQGGDRAGARPRRRALQERRAILPPLGSVRGSRFTYGCRAACQGGRARHRPDLACRTSQQL